VLGVSEVLKTIEYFRSVLGFECDPGSIYRGAGNEGAVYAIARRAGIAVHIQIRRRPLHLESRESHEGDLFFFVDDVAALYAEYQTKHVKVHRPLQDESYGVRDFTIELPDGHRLTFGARD
jgi:catechol 2,3-dioxygenase-like lactoylglutathione lyase family enzyme